MTTRRIPTQERSRQRVADIIDAALVLLRAGGVERCTMAALAVEARLTPPSLYRYFPDAAAVIRAVAEQTMDEIHAALVTTLAGIDSQATARDALRRGLYGYYDALAGDPALRELWTGTFGSPELVSLNIADSRRNGDLIAERVAPFSPVPLETLRIRAFLVAHLTGSGVALALQARPDERQALLVELERLIETIFE